MTKYIVEVEVLRKYEVKIPIFAKSQNEAEYKAEAKAKKWKKVVQTRITGSKKSYQGERNASQTSQ